MYERNAPDAGRYLTSFAKLIRHTLYGANEELIALANELEAMKYYLDLQRLRFNNKFEYTIEIDTDIIPESIHIPPLLIQPFLENAIEHGLQHKLSQGTLQLNISGTNKCLIVIIEDDGIGRAEARKLQKKKSKLHKSMGMEIVQKRIFSMNRAMNTNITLEIIDLKDENEKGIGTRVKICIPYKDKLE